MKISEDVLDELLKDTKTSEDLLGEQGLLKELRKRLVERMLAGELSDHLGYEKDDPAGRDGGNSRNGHSKKKVHSDDGTLELSIPRDRDGSFEPLLIPKHQRRFPGFDDKIISMYSRGMSDREIEEHIQDLYGVELSSSQISSITDQVLDEVRSWQNRSLDPLYPIIYLDALVVKVRHEGRIINKAVHLALGVNLEGHKDILGIWITENEGAKFWLKVLTDIHNRGVKDVFIACCDGLKGFPEAIETVFPKTKIQLCIVHMVRYSLKYVEFKDYKAVCQDLKSIYRAATLDEAEAQLTKFSDIWDEKYPMISQSWLRNWENVVPLFEYPQAIRRAIYTTNAIESVNHSLRKVLKTRGSFPTEEAVTKLIYLALRNISKRWSRPIKNWKKALNQFAILHQDRIEMYL